MHMTPLRDARKKRRGAQAPTALFDSILCLRVGQRQAGHAAAHGGFSHGAGHGRSDAPVERLGQNVAGRKFLIRYQRGDGAGGERLGRKPAARSRRMGENLLPSA